MMLEQASSAMRNAVSALSLSEQEVANLRAVVKELKEGQDGASGNEAVNRERAQLRAAQQRVQELFGLHQAERFWRPLIGPHVSSITPVSRP